MESNLVCRHLSDKQNRTTTQQESDLFNHECDYKTELDDTKFCYQLIITLTKSVIFKALLKSKNKKFQDYFLRAVKKKAI